MRRASALIAIPLLAALTAVGCGSSGTSSAPANQSVTATGKFDTAPKVTIPAAKASTDLVTKTLITGSGTKLTGSDSFIGNYVAYVWSGTTHKLATSTYTSQPAVFTGALLTGLKDAVSNKPVGSRVLAVIPPKYGFGSGGSSQLGIKGTDTLVFVIDLLQKITTSATGTKVSTGGGALPSVSDTATNPTITIPKNGAPPKTLTTKVLLKGSGAVVQVGQDVAVQYTGVIWRTGKVFDSSWASQPAIFPLKTPGMIPGFVDGLAGQAVGSRVLLVIPPKEGYGSPGNSQAGIKGTDTLVFVVDILGAVSGTSS